MILLSALEFLVISDPDDGSGIPLIKDEEHRFAALGGSWKAKVQRTPDKRLMHGKFGEGRFRAFALGGIVTWDSTFRDMIKVGRRKHPRNEADSCPLVNRIITSPPRLLPTNLLFYKALLPR